MRNIRKDLHLTQQEMALLLGVSRSAIALWESGLRSLPARATGLWQQLLLYWQQGLQRDMPIATPLVSETRAYEQEVINLLNARAQRAAARSVRITQQLEKMENRHRKLGARLYVMRHLLADSTAEPQRQVLRNRELMTRLLMGRCCSARREWLQYRLRALSSELKAAQSSSIKVLQQTG